MERKIKDKLYTLDEALNPERMRRELSEWSTEIWGKPLRVAEVEPEVVRRRNQRCVIRYRISFAGEPEQVTTLFGKVFKEGRGEAVFQKMQDLWRNGFASTNGTLISMPRPYVFLKHLNLLLQEEVPGKPVKEYINSEADEENLRILARTLAKLHQTRLTSLKEVFTVRDHLNRSHPKISFLKLALPDLAEVITRVVDFVLAWEKQARIEPLTPIHGDFHAGQVHIQGERSWLIDFDAMELSDPAADLGNMLVFLKAKRKLRKRDRFIESFLDEYFRHMDQDISRRIPIYEAITHLRRAAKRLRLQEEGWQKKARKMVKKAAEIIEQV